MAKQVAFPDIEDFALLFVSASGRKDDVLTAHVEVEVEDRAGPRIYREPVGPDCRVRLAGSSAARLLYVRPTEELLDWIGRNVCLLDRDRLDFEILVFPDQRARVLVNYNIIIGSRLLADIDAATVPAEV